MKTTHQFLEKYPILENSEKLIVGTIHPHEHERFSIPFFYGNVTSLWKILSDAFPTELNRPLNLEGILKFLANRKISVSDTIKKCYRTNSKALDKDLVVIELNKKIIYDIKKSKVSVIYFTSGFGKNNAFKLFYVDILGKKITAEIKRNREVTLDKELFGRPIKLIVLFSPSGSSNIPISKSNVYLENKNKYANSPRPVYEFKIDYYREKFK